ncbi:hypothetical protein YN1HA_28870 [Sulfurisphaera ohwakuensis]
MKFNEFAKNCKYRRGTINDTNYMCEYFDGGISQCTEELCPLYRGVNNE